MLHLAIIGIVCAVSALNGGTTFIEPKNNSCVTFCRTDKEEQTVKKICLPSAYNADYNFSEWVKENTTNRNNFFLYNYFIKQCRNKPNCRFTSNMYDELTENENTIKFPVLKRKLLWTQNKPTLTLKTLSPPLGSEHCATKKVKPCKKSKIPKKCMRVKANSKSKIQDKPRKCDLNCKEKQMLFSLKGYRIKPWKNKLRKRVIKRKNGDLKSYNEKRMLLSAMALKNHRKDVNMPILKRNLKNENLGEKNSSPLFNYLNGVFRYKKNYFNEGVRDSSKSHSVLVKNAQYRNFLVNNLVSNSYIPLKFQKEIRGRRSTPSPRCRKIFIPRPYLNSAHFKTHRIIIPKPLISRRKRRRYGNLKFFQKKLKNWPFLKMIQPYPKSLYGLRPKRFDEITTSMSTQSENAVMDSTFQNRSLTLKNETSSNYKVLENDTVKETTTKLYSDNSNEDIAETVTKSYSDIENTIPSNTLERPFLKRDFHEEEAQNEFMHARQENSIKNPELFKSFYHRPRLHINNKYLSPYRYLKIRHALRSYLIHNNAWISSEEDRRNKRCGVTCCPAPCRSWRAAPLLCIPYIKKGQDDVLRYLVKEIQKMIGKPFPPKRNIFDNTKYKPSAKKEPEQPCEDTSDDDEFDNETTFSPICSTASEPFTGHTTVRPFSSVPCSTKPPCFTKSYSTSPYFTSPKPQPTNPCTTLVLPFSTTSKPCFTSPCFSSSVPYPRTSYMTTARPFATTPCLTPPVISSVKQDSGLYLATQPSHNEISSTTKSVSFSIDNPVNIRKPPNNGCGSSTEIYTSTQPIIYIKNIYYGTPCPPTSTPNPFYATFPNTQSPSAFSEIIEASSRPYENEKNFTNSSRKWPYSETSLCSPKFPFFISQIEQYIKQQRTNPFCNGTVEYSMLPLDMNSNQMCGALSTESPQAMPSSASSTYNKCCYCLSSKCPESNASVTPVSGTPSFQAPNVSMAATTTTESLTAITPKEETHVTNSCSLLTPQPSVKENKYFTSSSSDEILTVETETEIENYIPEFKIPSPTNEIQNEGFATRESRTESANLLVRTSSLPKMTNSPNSFVQRRYPSKENEMNFREKEQQQFLNYPFHQKAEKNEERNRESKLSKAVRENNLRKAMEYDDYLLNQLPPKNFVENFRNYRRLLKKKHHMKDLNQNYRLRQRAEYPAYDYNIDDQDSFLKLNHGTHRKESNPLTVPRYFWKGMNNKIKKHPQDSYIRRKRGNNYDSWPEMFESYNDYLDDFNSIEENSKKHEEVVGDRKNQSDWIPPNYDMFSELAEAIHTTTTSVVLQNTTLEATTNSSGLKNSNESPHSKQTKQTSDTLINKNSTDLKCKIAVNSTKFNDATTVSMINGKATSSESLKNNKKHLTVESTTLSSNATTTTFVSAPSSRIVSTSQPIHCKTLAISKNLSESTTPLTATKSNHEQVLDHKSKGKSLASVKAISRTTVSNTGYLTTVRNLKKDAEEDVELDSDHYLDIKEGKMPTTLKAAVIVKGPKKSLAKPSPKVYSKVYPDSFPIELEINETVATTAPNSIATKTVLFSSTTKPDIRLQLLAVCEGYLEVVKLIKAQNQTIGEDLDADLARYCESIISQSFNSQSDKPKKLELSEPQSYKTTYNVLKNANPNLKTTRRSVYATEEEFPDLRLHEKIFEDLLNDPIYKRELAERIKGENVKNSDYLDDYKNIENESSPKTLKDQMELLEKDNLLKKGITEEQVELINLLRKRKRALLTWLFNTKEQVKSGDVQETEYFDDEDLIAPEPDVSEYSGTIKPKRGEKSCGITNTNSSFVDESIFPVYAKQYGYDKGGEIREVEVLWRKVNEETHEEEIFKNLSVLALLLTSTISPNVNPKDTKLVGNGGFENEEMSENELKGGGKVNFHCDLHRVTSKTAKTTQCLSETLTTTEPTTVACTTVCDNPKTKFKRKNGTFTFVNKPDTSSIVGTPPNVTKARPNATHKPSHKFGVAKDIFQEYTIEFLNYAVYILPIMFTILFLFCCTCCVLHILKTKKSIKRLKKKRKQLLSTDDTTETSDESERSRKKRKWRKKKNKCNENENLEKKGSKKFWNVLKLPSRTSRDFNDCEKKKYFLRFLKSRKCDTTDVTSAPVHELDEYSKKYADSGGEGKANESDFCNEKIIKKKDEDHSEAAERRELIALLEELKKIETEQTEEKKEVKSVHVQYTTQEDENSGFRHPDFSCPYHKYVLGFPQNYPFYEKNIRGHAVNPAFKNFEIYEDVNELTTLLPCENGFYPKRNDILGNFRINEKGRCKCFFKIARNSDMSQNKLFTDRNFRKSEKSTGFIINKCENINMDPSEELMGDVEVEKGLTGHPFAYKLPYKKSDEFVEEMENFKRQLNKKKSVRLKDDGVLCKL